MNKYDEIIAGLTDVKKHIMEWYDDMTVHDYCVDIANKLDISPSVNSIKINEDRIGTYTSYKCTKAADKKEENNMPYKYDMTKYSPLTSHRTVGVKSVDVYNNRVVKVTFTDGTFTKAVCSENDTFNEDMGITICLLKKMLSSATNGGDGNKLYNNLMRDIHRYVKAQEEFKNKQKEEARKRHEEDVKRQENNRIRKQKAKEAQIDMMKTAYIQAIKETKGE